VEFMLLFLQRKGQPEGDPAAFAAMGKFAGELAGRGMLRRGAPLAVEATGARIRMRDGKALVSDGPFAETKEVLGGFWVIEAESRAEAIEIACRCPHAQRGIVEVHQLRFRDAVSDPGTGTPFLLAFLREPGLSDCDGAKLKEMLDFGNGLKRERRFIETAPLASDPLPARVARHGEKIAVTDGPFAETKEGVGGYSLVRLGSRAEAIDLATRYPHAKWGPVEVREILFFDPTGPP